MSDMDPSSLTDVYDAEEPEHVYTKTNGQIPHVNTAVRKASSESITDVRVLSPDHMLALEKQRQRRDREPLLYCKLITRWPVQSFRKLFYCHNETFLVFVYGDRQANG